MFGRLASPRELHSDPKVGQSQQKHWVEVHTWRHPGDSSCELEAPFELCCGSEGHTLTQITLQVVISKAEAEADDLSQKSRGFRSLKQCKLFVQSSPAKNRSRSAISDLRQHVSQLPRKQ